MFQTSRDERSSSAPTPEAAGNGSRELLEETLKGPKPYPNIVLPTGGGFWIDGQDQNEYESTTASGGTSSWNNKIETDDTAKAYRRYYMGRVSLIYLYCKINNITWKLHDLYIEKMLIIFKIFKMFNIHNPRVSRYTYNFQSDDASDWLYGDNISIS